MSYKSEVIKRLEGTRDCAIENAEDLYPDEMDELCNNHGHDYTKDNPYVWFKVLEDARHIQAVINALKILDEESVKEIAEDFIGVA